MSKEWEKLFLKWELISTVIHKTFLEKLKLKISDTILHRCTCSNILLCFLVVSQPVTVFLEFQSYT
jgi:hypothetical protein